MAGLESAMLAEALKKYGGITKVAAHFGLARSTIFRKVKRFGIGADGLSSCEASDQ
jgi:transcriptional regulator of acetoin/glycerol metabolism